ncbi:DUF3558 domain-containing protein [Nocardia aurantia]|uniref:DUF3558 domain-containing protein n=1 Tax=Nocardia aurantia TaxID=2585199 RepID=A0A7K0DWV6_9NOCA|nr:DUF3558 domain-containing protein [Nocardia aurantia]MQY29792.1 hypothetical protein [Nocardia aurantia]
MRAGFAVTMVTTALVVGAAAGCGSSGSGGETSPSGRSTSATTTLAAQAPTGFDPCHDIPTSVLDSEGLDHKATNADSDGSGGAKWRGCIYAAADGYGASIRTTNITLPMVRSNIGFAVAGEMVIGDRRALSYHDVDQPDHRAFCLLNLEMKGGSLEISIDNPASSRKTGRLESCDIAKGLATKLAPLIASGT